ncbi:MAG: prepilin-type N-terminal cleavage/methylation domain-containing protein [Planctomycetota bacterium]
MSLPPIASWDRRVALGFTGPSTTRRSQGFTLIELLTVIGIIAILMGLLIPAVMMARTWAKKAKAQTVVTNVAAAIDSYRSMNGCYPERLLVTAAMQSDPVTGPLVSSFAVGTELYDKLFKGVATSAVDWQAVNAVLTYHLGSAAAELTSSGTGLMLDPYGKPLRYRPSKWYPFDSGAAETGETRIDSAKPPNPDSFQLWSIGADLTEGYGETADDLPNWKKN